MSTFRVNKNVNYTVMSNHHLQDKRLSLKAKGLLSYMLSLPDDWDYSLKGLTTGCRDGIDSVRSAVHELEDGGYLCRSKVRDARGRIIDYNYEVFELPQKERIEKRPAPVPNSPSSENPMSGFPTLENPTQQNTNAHCAGSGLGACHGKPQQRKVHTVLYGRDAPASERGADCGVFRRDLEAIP